MSNYIEVTKEEYEIIMDGDDSDRFKVIEKGDWISEGKFECREVIVKETSTNKYYAAVQSRSGSWFTDYEFEDDLELVEVEPVEVTKIEYKVV